jgi:hypothetical protein
MAKYTVTHACGCVETHRLTELRRKDRDRKADWLATTLCRSCFLKRRAEAVQAESVAAGLPALEGAPGQIEWATKVRLAVLSRLDAAIAEGLAEAPSLPPEALDALRRIEAARDVRLSWTSAQQWLDGRDVSIPDIARGFVT